MPPSESLTFDVRPAALVTKEILEQSATLFSEEYGICGPLVGENMGRWCKPGARIKMSAQKLQQQSLNPGTESILFRCRDHEVFIGHAFATRWDAGERKVCWVTQLCVRIDYRRRGVATALLKHLKREANEVFGIMSSHPGALGSSLETLDLSLIRTNAQSVLTASPVEYISRAQLRGVLFIKHQRGSQDEHGTGRWECMCCRLRVLGRSYRAYGCDGERESGTCVAAW